MATVEKTVSILFFGEDQLSDKITNIQKNLTSFSSSIESVAAPLAGVADGVLKTNAALLALAAGGLAYAYTKSIAYEQATIELQKVMGDSETITKELEDQFTALSRTYGESTTSIISSLAELRQSGYSTAEGMEVLDVSLQLNRASELETEEATNLLKRSLIGYNLEVKDARKLGDLWNHTSQVSNTNVSKLAEAFAVVARQASDAGFSLSEVGAAVTPIIGVFDSGEEAGVAFSTMLSRLLDPTPKAEKAIRMLTGATGPLNEEFATGKELFEAVAIGLQSVDDRTGAVAVSQIVGVQQAKRIKVAFDDYFKTLEKIGPAADQYNSLQKEVDLQNASSRASVDRLIVGFQALAETMGTQFRSAASEAVDGGTAIENALEDIIKDGTFQPVFDALNEFGNKVGKFLKEVAIAMPEAFEQVDFAGLLDALGDVGDSLGELFDDLDLTEPEDLAKAIQFIVDSLETLARVTKGMFDVFVPLIQNIIESTKGFNSMDDATKETAGNILGVAKAITGLGVVTAGLLVTLGQHAEAIETAFSLVINSIKFMWNSTVITVEGILLFIAEAVQDLLKVMGAVSFGDFADSLNEAAEEVQIFQDSLKEDIAERAQSNLDILSKAFTETSEAARETTAAIKDIPAEINSEIIIAANLAELEANLDLAGVLVKEQDSTIVIDADTTKATENITEVTQELEEKLPAEKIIEIKLQGEIDTEISRIKAQAETAQEAMEWTAKLSIAEAESSAKILESIFSAMSNTISSTGQTLTGLFGLLASDKLATLTKWNIEDQIDKESNMREEAHKETMELSKVQREYLEAKVKAFESGEGLINISCEGLAPELEAFMWKILEKIQIRATADQAEFLLGV